MAKWNRIIFLMMLSGMMNSYAQDVPDNAGNPVQAFDQELTAARQQMQTKLSNYIQKLNQKEATAPTKPTNLPQTLPSSNQWTSSNPYPEHPNPWTAPSTSVPATTAPPPLPPGQPQNNIANNPVGAVTPPGAAAAVPQAPAMQSGGRSNSSNIYSPTPTAAPNSSNALAPGQNGSTQGSGNIYQ